MIQAIKGLFIATMDCLANGLIQHSQPTRKTNLKIRKNVLQTSYIVYTGRKTFLIFNIVCANS